MPKVQESDYAKYAQSSGRSELFKLKEDKESAIVRFLVKSHEDIELIIAHTIPFNGQKRSINCLRNFDDPIDACPLCERGEQLIKQVYIPLMVYVPGASGYTAKKMVWSGGITLKKFIDPNLAEYGDLSGYVFKLVRSGVANSTSVSYSIFPQSPETAAKCATVSTEPNQSMLGSLVLDKTYDEIMYYLEKGSFPAESYAAPRAPEPTVPYNVRGGALQSQTNQSTPPTPPAAPTPPARSAPQNSSQNGGYANQDAARSSERRGGDLGSSLPFGRRGGL